MRGLAGFSNCCGTKTWGSSAAISRTRRTAPAMPSLSGTRIRSAPRALMSFFRSSLISFRHNDPHAVAHEPADQSQTDAGITAGRLADDRVGLQFAVALGSFQHGQRHAILDTAARVKKLRLGENPLALEPQQRRVTDQFENIVCKHWPPAKAPRLYTHHSSAVVRRLSRQHRPLICREPKKSGLHSDDSGPSENPLRAPGVVRSTPEVHKAWYSRQRGRKASRSRAIGEFRVCLIFARNFPCQCRSDEV